MAAETYLLGKDVLLFKYNTVDEEWEPVACATSNTFGTTINFLESITKCDSATRRNPTSKNHTATVDLIVSTAASRQLNKVYDNILQDEADAMSKSWYAFLSSEPTTKTIQKYFEAYVESIEYTAERESNVECSVAFAIDGDAVDTDPFPAT